MKVARILALPALTWFLFLLFAPVFLVFAVSFAHRGIYGGLEWSFSFANYGRLFSTSVASIAFETVLLAAATAASCAMLGVFAAWAMAAALPARRDLYLGLIALPFLTNGLIRMLGVKELVGLEGPVQFFLRLFSLPHDPFWMTANPVLVFYGMIASYLPFAVLPLYGAFEKFDFSLVEAAQDLGAGSWSIFRSVVWPNLRTALSGAFLLVFIPCLGEYVVPDVLGGAKTMLLGNLITEQFLKSRDWPFGAAVAVGLIASLVLAWGVSRLVLVKRLR